VYGNNPFGVPITKSCIGVIGLREAEAYDRLLPLVSTSWNHHHIEGFKAFYILSTQAILSTASYSFNSRLFFLLFYSRSGSFYNKLFFLQQAILSITLLFKKKCFGKMSMYGNIEVNNKPKYRIFKFLNLHKKFFLVGFSSVPTPDWKSVSRHNGGPTMSPS